MSGIVRRTKMAGLTQRVRKMPQQRALSEIPSGDNITPMPVPPRQLGQPPVQQVNCLTRHSDWVAANREHVRCAFATEQTTCVAFLILSPLEAI